MKSKVKKLKIEIGSKFTEQSLSWNSLKQYQNSKGQTHLQGLLTTAGLWDHGQAYQAR